ncbi:hypothetical protein GW17_00034729 [Ensete ventricosum]|nr:hypothetical protein GW17_00034729 [Ensete ventricosum]
MRHGTPSITRSIQFKGFFLGKISFQVFRSLHCSGLYVSEPATLLVRKIQLHSFRHRVRSSQASRSSPFLSFLPTRLPQHYKKLKKTVRSPPPCCCCCVCLLIPSNDRRREKRSQQGRMEGKEGPSSSPLMAVACCMCGDRGISDELFRCKICHFRLQHKYCSNLYPTTKHYSSCNWCLRDGGRNAAVQESTMDQTHSLSSSSDLAAGAGFRVKFHRDVSATHLKTLSETVKKRRTTARRSPPAVIGKSQSDLPSLGSSRPKQAFRSKVRKFKLLEEVCS